MKKITRHIPNAITGINLLGGTAAILCATTDAAPSGLTSLQWAYIFIAIAAVADFFDGFAARALKAYSPMGKELDSLCDLVSFGVAPTVLLFVALGDAGAPVWIRWCALFPALCGAFRLARFNVSPEENSFFTGLPIPANAIFWIGYTSELCAWNNGGGLVTLAVMIVVGWLMVSPVRLWSMKFKTYGFVTNWPRWSVPIVCAVCCVCFGVGGLMWTIVYYVLLSLVVRPVSK